jgi:exocyst complex component 5
MSRQSQDHSVRNSNSTPRAPLFTLDTFSSKDFVVKDWIEKLSDDAAPRRQSASTTGPHAAFDPKPLIRAFEASRSELLRLSDQLESRENELSTSVRKAEAAQQQVVMTTEKRMQQSISQFNRLDNSLNGVPDTHEDESGAGSYMALRIGERLEELERQRQRAQDAKNLLLCWLEVSERGSLSSLEQLKRKPGGDGKVKSAALARQLLTISQRLEQDDGTNGANGLTNGARTNGKDTTQDQSNKRHTRELIEKFLEGLETDLLQQFDQHYRRQNYEGMKECATALRDFNDGASVTGLFVNQHTFFIDRNQLLSEEIGDTETWDRIADPDTEPPGVEPGLQAVIDDVKITVQQESWIIKRAFPVPEEVLNTFVQRVFQQSIQQRLEMVLQKAGSISSLSFLRALQSSRAYISSLVEDLKTHGLIEHPEHTSPQVTATLDQQLEELFVPYLAGSSYIEREKRNLDELYSSLLFKFTTYHVRIPSWR